MNDERRRRESKELNFIIRNSLVASGAAEGGETLFDIRYSFGSPLGAPVGCPMEGRPPCRPAGVV